jgi:hypothetical protein
MEVSPMSRHICLVVLVVLAVLHSALGERRLLGPLFAAALPRHALPLGRAFTQRTLRFAWHLLSVAWLALAWIVAHEENAAALVPVGATLLASGALAFVVSRGRHFAWALFAVGGVAGLVGPRAEAAGPFAAGVAAAVLASIAALHVAWMCGARWGMRAVVPEVSGRPAFVPGPQVTALVTVAFGAAGALVLGASRSASPVWTWLTLAGACVFALRALGDFRLVGLTKRVHGTAFARWDDGLFTPLSVLLAVCFVIVGANGLR